MEQGDLQRKKEALFAAMDGAGLEGYWVVKPENIRYLTGFHGEDSTLLAASGKYYLITDRRYSEEARGLAFVSEVEERSGPMPAAAVDLCKRLPVRRVCITASNLNCADYKDISGAGAGMDICLRRPGIVEGMRLRKSKHEVESIETALRVAEEGFRRFLSHIENGRPERWLAGRLEWDVRCAGAEGAAFDTICAVAENASRPHSRPTGRCLAGGESLLVDWGGRVQGYNSDLTRLIALGTMPSEVKELSEIVIAAQEAAFEVIGPDVEAGAVDAAARRVIEDAGYGRYFSHGVGHGIGLEVHERPSLAPGKKERLQSGMVVTIEPAIYIPSRCGVRIEEMVCITGDGHVRLSGLERTPVCI